MDAEQKQQSARYALQSVKAGTGNPRSETRKAWVGTAQRKGLAFAPRLSPMRHLPSAASTYLIGNVAIGRVNGTCPNSAAFADPMGRRGRLLDAYRAACINQIVGMYSANAVIECACGGRKIIQGKASQPTGGTDSSIVLRSRSRTCRWTAGRWLFPTEPQAVSLRLC